MRREYGAIFGSLQYVQRQWQRQNLPAALSGVTPADVGRSLDQVNDILFIRLFSTFEGILREHLIQHHPGIRVPEEVRSVWLIDRTAQRQTPALSTPLRSKVHEVRRFRNFLVHRGGVVLPVVPFSVALARLSKFVDYLPEPRP